MEVTLLNPKYYQNEIWNLAPVLQIVQKIPENLLFCLYLSFLSLVCIYQLAQFGHLMSCGSKDILKWLKIQKLSASTNVKIVAFCFSRRT